IGRLSASVLSNVIVADTVGDTEDELKGLCDSNNIAIIVRLSPDYRLSRTGMGYIILGGKRSGTFYNKQDISMCETLANGLTLALQNAYRYEEIKHFNETLQQKIDEATKKLRRTNERLRLL